jgi:SAM-dependent methyltransferase
MNAIRESNAQENLWNGTAGRAWVDAQETLDEMLEPFADLLVQAVAATYGGSVLDVGCGTGGTTLAVARQLGEKARCVGIDISGPMIDAARARAEREGVQTSFIRADAEAYAFERGRFDAIISRFGVMFFDDFVEAFTNLRRAARPGATLNFVAWRSPEENAFMTTAERAAAPFFPGIPPREPDAPGQFAFADAHRIARILADSGWNDIDIQPIDVACTFPAAQLDRYFMRLGPLGLVLQEADEQTRARVVQAVRSAFDPYVHGAEVRFDAACWLTRARAAKSSAVQERSNVR